MAIFRPKIAYLPLRVGIQIFVLLRSPCKISGLYNNSFWENEQRARIDRKKEREKEENKLGLGCAKLRSASFAYHLQKKLRTSSIYKKTEFVFHLQKKGRSSSKFSLPTKACAPKNVHWC